MKELEGLDVVVLIDKLCGRLGLVVMMFVGIDYRGEVLIGGFNNKEHVGFNIGEERIRKKLHEALDRAINEIIYPEY